MSSEEIIPDIQSKSGAKKGPAQQEWCCKQRRKTLLQGGGGFQQCLWGQGWQGDMGVVLSPQRGQDTPAGPHRAPAAIPEVEPPSSDTWMGSPGQWWPWPQACPCPHHPQLLRAGRTKPEPGAGAGLGSLLLTLSVHNPQSAKQCWVINLSNNRTIEVGKPSRMMGNPVITCSPCPQHPIHLLDPVSPGHPPESSSEEDPKPLDAQHEGLTPVPGSDNQNLPVPTPSCSFCTFRPITIISLNPPHPFLSASKTEQRLWPSRLLSPFHFPPAGCREKGFSRTQCL